MRYKVPQSLYSAKESGLGEQRRLSLYDDKTEAAVEVSGALVAVVHVLNSLQKNSRLYLHSFDGSVETF